MNSGIWSALSGATRYEFLMQLRRKSIWIATFMTSLITLSFGNSLYFVDDSSMLVIVARWAMDCNAVLPIVFGVLLADRLPRDRRLHVSDLLDALPASSGSRLTGKYFGSALATATPIAVVYLIGVAYILVIRHDPLTIPLALAAFLAIIVPGLLFVGAFSVVVPAVLWVPLYQFLFVGYWFWGNLLPPSFGIPTISTTWLTPAGSFAAAGLFGHGEGMRTFSGTTAPAWEGVASIAVLLGSAALALFIAQRYLSWQRARQ